MSHFHCVFRDHAGGLCGQANVEADNFEQIAQWASEILSKQDARPKGVEIWQGEERMASFGTAFRPERRRGSRRRQQHATFSIRKQKSPESENQNKPHSWLKRIVRSIWS